VRHVGRPYVALYLGIPAPYYLWFGCSVTVIGPGLPRPIQGYVWGYADSGRDGYEP
jgi:hypothetical protein